MATGLVINEQVGTNSVRDGNPLPVKIGDGTRIVDVTTIGAVGTFDGLVLYGRDTAGTYFPLPLTAGGGTMITLAGSGGTLGSEVLVNQGTAGADPWPITGTVVATGVTVTGGTEVKLLNGTNTVGSFVVASLPSVTIGTALPASNALIGTVSIGAGGTVAVTVPSITIGTALPASNAVIGTVTVGNALTGTVAVTTGSVYLLNQLIPQSFDAITLAYTGGSDISQVVYKTGGTAGAAVATLTLGYSGGSLTSVART